MRELPGGWKWKRLGDVATVSSGNGAPQGDDFFVDGKFPFVRTFDVGKEKANNNLVNVRDYLNEHAIEENRMHLFPEKTVLVPKSGASTFLNHRALLGTPAYVSSHLATVNANDNLLPEFLFYWSQTLDARTITHDINYPSLKLSEIESVQIPLPPLFVQRQIVSILEKAETMKRQRQEIDVLIDVLVQSIFIEMFGDPSRNERRWEEKTLDEILNEDPQNGLYKPSSEYGEHGTPIIRIDAFYNGKIGDLRKLKRIKCNQNEITKYLIHEGDVLINRVNSLKFLGKCGLVQNLYENTIYECNMIRIRPNRSLIDPTYLTTFLCTPYVKNQILNRAKNAVNQSSINQQDVKSLTVLVPPLPLQQQFTRVVQDVERIRERQLESGKEINTLFNGIMQKAFCGELLA